MLTIRPVRRALAPADSEAARRVSALNYDEFQGDAEIWAAIRTAPDSVLAVTMAHCAVPEVGDILPGDSEESLARARANFDRFRASPLVRLVERILFIYEIEDPSRPGVRQIGLGGLAPTADIRTDATPRGPIIRNEGVRPPKARGRARLIEATGAIIGTVNNAVPDERGAFAAGLERFAGSAEPDYEADGAGDTRHRIWLVREPGDIARLQRLLAAEPEAYVADGNHRSAAAAMLGRDSFLAVFFPAGRMGIAPYNRLARVRVEKTAGEAGDFEAAVDAALARSFDARPAGPAPLQPSATHQIGVYTARGGWRSASPREGVFDVSDAAASIDHDIVQRTLLADLGIPDAVDERLTYVGANRDAGWLMAEVNAGRAEVAITLPAVTMRQFADVCRQRRIMPPKSTWFVPKIRSGLVVALLDDA